MPKDNSHPRGWHQSFAPTNTILVRLLEATPGGKARIHIQTALDKGIPVVELLKNKISKLEKYDKALSLKSVEKNIHVKADQICEIVRKQEASLCAEAKEFYKKQEAIIDHQKNNLIKLHSNAASTVQTAQQNLEQSTSSELVDLANGLVQQLEGIARIKLEEPEDVTPQEDILFDLNEEAQAILDEGRIGKISRKNMRYIKESATQKHVPSNEPRQDVCMVCGATATHYCNTCSKLYCLNCMDLSNRMQCEMVAQIHRIVERTSSQEKDFMDKDKCVNCKKPSTHECSICKIIFCAVCQHVVPFKDQCQSNIGHVFVLIKSISYNRPQSLDAEIQRELNQQNICDQCSMSAKFICADCHNRVCKECLVIFKRDLCPATKKEHFFHTITSQSQRTDTKKAKSWSCERCTYSNPPENTICSMCATTKGISGIKHPESGTSRCGVCTYENKEGARICAMCHRTLDLDKVESYL